MECVNTMEKLHLEEHNGSSSADATSAGSGSEGMQHRNPRPRRSRSTIRWLKYAELPRWALAYSQPRRSPEARAYSEEPLIHIEDPVYRTELIERFCATALQLSRDKVEALSRLHCDERVFKGSDHDAVWDWYKKNSMLKRFGTFITNSSGHISDNKAGRGVYPIFSRINHSCIPNARYGRNETIKRLTVHVSRDFEEGEQIFVSYLPLLYDNRAKRAGELKESWGFQCYCEACCDPNSDVGRAKMNIMQLLLESYANGNEEVPKFMQLAPLQSRQEGLATTSSLAELMKSEGLVTMELVKLYRVCSQYCWNLDDLDEAIEYAEKALDIEICLIGLETEHLRENLIGCQYWLEMMQALKSSHNAEAEEKHLALD
ncbi:hypothetical protein PG994_008281 [Apiospora phragmitis]|uniref:SET domain-containing protein n=1 Tax=Apiospora phragmitis TaxID=2905665 RepID=A0ABR1USK8_9PEZI